MVNARQAMTMVLLAALLAAAVLLARPVPALAQGGGTTYALTIKRGQLDPTVSEDTLFGQIETDQGHGPLQNGREVQPVSAELDIIAPGSDSFSIGVGFEILRYKKVFEFQDGTELTVDNRGLHFSFKTFWRLGAVMPYLGLGIGNYYAKIEQTNGFSVRDAPEEVFNYRAGFFLQFDGFGFLLEGGRTTGKLSFPGQSGPAEIELGGSYTNVGISFIF